MYGAGVAQRGAGVFESSLLGLRKLNALGYGNATSGRVLNLVYNPVGPSLPPPQSSLEALYQRELGALGIVFNHLYVLANMPINRFGSMLVSQGRFDTYMSLLRSAHDPANVDHVMCRRLVSVDWQGRLFDCDFNQMLGIRSCGAHGPPLELDDLLNDAGTPTTIAVGAHCYGCTAGQGSSCGGALA